MAGYNKNEILDLLETKMHEIIPNLATEVLYIGNASDKTYSNRKLIFAYYTIRDILKIIFYFNDFYIIKSALSINYTPCQLYKNAILDYIHKIRTILPYHNQSLYIENNDTLNIYTYDEIINIYTVEHNALDIDNIFSIEVQHLIYKFYYRKIHDSTKEKIKKIAELRESLKIVSEIIDKKTGGNINDIDEKQMKLDAMLKLLGII